MKINYDYYPHDFKTIVQLTDDQHNNIVVTTDNIALNQQQILLDGLIKNLSQYTHQIDKDE
ncbi:hypothetical protein WH390_04825 [Candidatus Arsenophonus nilaparvatae]|uniref:hypothetical protein n=1 Tax=Candidatus Arsenophonus nilaparvatae TaxID=1247023 RepID=UPI00050A00EB|nr:hypothetical protein [Candidatus Arsenophonus nilaparvatae]